MRSTDVPDGDEAGLHATVDRLVADMLAAGLAEKVLETDGRTQEEYWVLPSPGALDKQLVAVAVPGYPERAGVWSYTFALPGFSMGAGSCSSSLRAGLL